MGHVQSAGIDLPMEVAAQFLAQRETPHGLDGVPAERLQFQTEFAVARHRRGYGPVARRFRRAGAAGKQRIGRQAPHRAPGSAAGKPFLPAQRVQNRRDPPLGKVRYPAGGQGLDGRFHLPVETAPPGHGEEVAKPRLSDGTGWTMRRPRIDSRGPGILECRWQSGQRGARTRRRRFTKPRQSADANEQGRDLVRPLGEHGPGQGGKPLAGLVRGQQADRRR